MPKIIDMEGTDTRVFYRSSSSYQTDFVCLLSFSVRFPFISQPEPQTFLSTTVRPSPSQPLPVPPRSLTPTDRTRNFYFFPFTGTSTSPTVLVSVSPSLRTLGGSLTEPTISLLGLLHRTPVPSEAVRPPWTPGRV